MRRVGYCLSEKKEKRYRLHEMAPALRLDGIELVKIDLNASLEAQGPFDVIMHHINSLISLAEDGSTEAAQQIKQFEDYLKRHPETELVNPLAGVNSILDRKSQYDLVKECADTTTDFQFSIPSYVELYSEDPDTNQRTMDQGGVTFPLIAKPLNSSSHQMSLVFCSEGLAQIPKPCLGQSFINHDALLYKVMVLDESAFTVTRPSVRNLDAGENEPNIVFQSQSVSKKESQGSLIQRPDTDECAHSEPCKQHLESLALRLRQHTGLDMLGVDVIVESGSDRCYVIDINAFPGFEGIVDFKPLLIDLFKKCIQRKLAKEQTTNSL